MALSDNKNDSITDITEDDILWLKELIDNDFEQFELPESLKSENLIHRLDDIVQEPPKTKSVGKTIYLKFLSAAACFALVIFGWQHFSIDSGISTLDSTEKAIPQAAAFTAEAPMAAAAMDTTVPCSDEETDVVMEMELDDGTAEINIPEQPTAKSYDEIFSVLSEMAKNQTIADDAASGDIVTYPSAGNSMVTAKAQGVYETNTQISGIDEADTVKTDGKYIYHYRFNSVSEKSEIKITDADGLKVASTITLDDNGNSEIYITDNRLILVRNMSRDASEQLFDSLTDTVSDYTSEQRQSDIIIPEYRKKNLRRNNRFTEAIVFDITDKTSPKEINRFRQDGEYVSSRMKEDTLCLVSSKRLFEGGVSPGIEARFYLPYAGNENGISPIAAENILLPSYRENFNYAVVTSMNTVSGKTDTKAVLGMADEIMMSQNSLYLTADIYDGKSGRNNNATAISRFALTDDGLKYIADTTVKGCIDNQFSLDEHNGFLRIATTSYNDDGDTVNNLYVLDSGLKSIGALENLAPDERIYSVRYMGDTAYIVTFKETDPLFVIDLSDPAAPSVKGQLKIPGFSEYLHPLNENTLIGLGYNTVSLKNGGIITDGLKLSLFDVSDPLAPREKYNCLIGNHGSDSVATQEHKAFMYYPEKNIFGFPATVYTSYGASADDPYSGEGRLSFSGFLVFRAGEGEFEVLSTISPDQTPSANSFMRNELDSAIERGIYIKDTLYTISASGISSYSLDTFSLKAKMKY